MAAPREHQAKRGEIARYPGDSHAGSRLSYKKPSPTGASEPTTRTSLQRAACAGTESSSQSDTLSVNEEAARAARVSEVGERNLLLLDDAAAPPLNVGLRETAASSSSDSDSEGERPSRALDDAARPKPPSAIAVRDDRLFVSIRQALLQSDGLSLAFYDLHVLRRTARQEATSKGSGLINTLGVLTRKTTCLSECKHTQWRYTL